MQYQKFSGLSAAYGSPIPPPRSSYRHWGKYLPLAKFEYRHWTFSKVDLILPSLHKSEPQLQSAAHPDHNASKSFVSHLLSWCSCFQHKNPSDSHRIALHCDTYYILQRTHLLLHRSSRSSYALLSLYIRLQKQLLTHPQVAAPYCTWHKVLSQNTPPAW